MNARFLQFLLLVTALAAGGCASVTKTDGERPTRVVAEDKVQGSGEHWWWRDLEDKVNRSFEDGR